MIDDVLSLKRPLKKRPGTDLLREMIGVAAQQLMELEVGRLIWASFDEKAARSASPRAKSASSASGSTSTCGLLLTAEPKRR